MTTIASARRIVLRVDQGADESGGRPSFSTNMLVVMVVVLAVIDMEELSLKLSSRKRFKNLLPCRRWV